MADVYLRPAVASHYGLNSSFVPMCRLDDSPTTMPALSKYLETGNIAVIDLARETNLFGILQTEIVLLHPQIVLHELASDALTDNTVSQQEAKLGHREYALNLIIIEKSLELMAREMIRVATGESIETGQVLDLISRMLQSIEK